MARTTRSLYSGSFIALIGPTKPTREVLVSTSSFYFPNFNVFTYTYACLCTLGTMYIFKCGDRVCDFFVISCDHFFFKMLVLALDIC